MGCCRGIYGTDNPEKLKEVVNKYKEKGYNVLMVGNADTIIEKTKITNLKKMRDFRIRCRFRTADRHGRPETGRAVGLSDESDYSFVGRSRTGTGRPPTGHRPACRFPGAAGQRDRQASFRPDSSLLPG